jgi:type II secretory pathway pseudopilin PulG
MVKRQRGFTYLAVLFGVAILASSLGVIGEMWDTSAKREKEAELLFVGHQYRVAIQRYYLSGPQRQYPPSLEVLLKDPRLPGTVRYLRRIYLDPVTGEAMMPIPGPQGGIVGVRSASEVKPLKVAGFKVRDAAFEGKQKYSEWQFVFSPAPGAAPGTKPAPAKPRP